MESFYIEDKLFDKIDYTKEQMAKADYDKCQFLNCNFSNTDLSKIKFTDCEFKGCNLSMVRLNKTAFLDTKFTGCKLLGLHFETCDDFVISVYFDNCILNFSSFLPGKTKENNF